MTDKQFEIQIKKELDSIKKCKTLQQCFRKLKNIQTKLSKEIGKDDKSYSKAYNDLIVGRI